MSKHIFSKIAKIGEEVRSAEPVKVEFNALNDLKGFQTTIRSASQKVSNELNTVMTSLAAAQKVAETALVEARKAQAMAKSLGVDEGQFNGWEKQFVAERDSFESARAAIVRIQNNI